jgi:hypothetical protein
MLSHWKLWFKYRYILHKYKYDSCRANLPKVLSCTISYYNYEYNVIIINPFKPESESKPCVTTDGQSASLSWNKAPIWGLRPDLYYCQTVAGALSLRRGRVYRLQLLLALVSAVVLGFESRGTCDIFYCLKFETSVFVASYDSEDCGGGIRPRLHAEFHMCVCVLCYDRPTDPSPNNASVLVLVFVAAETYFNKTLSSNGCLCDCSLTS